MKFFSILFLFCLYFSPVFSDMHHHYVDNRNVIGKSYYWKEKDISSFEELLISWNALRPKQGYYSIYVSVNTGSWSPWMPYAEWGNDFQKSFSSTQKNISVRVYQDAVEVIEGNLGCGFRIKIIAEDGADISDLKSIHVCASNLNSISYNQKFPKINTSYLLPVKGLSQMALTDERKERLCSPTSTTAVIRFLKNEETLNPIQFAEKCWDSGFDIFGNWVFNIAEAYNQIRSSSYSCWVERLESFQNILDSLKEGYPVVISIRGPLPCSALPYKSGHLIAVIGFDSSTNEVICMDPAFDKNEKTKVRYKLDDLLKAWERRKNVSYIFKSSKMLY